jgi:predicted dehydrogenase
MFIGDFMKIIVIGCGSIGRRHMKNLIDLNVDEVIGVDLSEEYCEWARENLSLKTYTDLKEALEKEKPNGVLICTPPSSHVKLAKIVTKYNSHIFIEKPISDSLEGIDELIEITNHKCTVGYNLRFNKGIQKIKKIIEDKKYGKILYSKILVGQYLPDWRPWQDYKESYTARKELGGGIILDASHEIDYALWFFGTPKKIFSISDKVSNLEVNVEDTSEIIMQFENKIIVNIHLDFVRRDKKRYCEIVFENGTIYYDLINNELKEFDVKENKWDIEKIEEEVNEMYVNEMKHFIKMINENIGPSCSLEEAKKTLEVCLKIKENVKI